MFTVIKIIRVCLLLLVHVTFFAYCVFAITDGQIPNQSYSIDEQWTIISPQMSNRHMNQPSIFNGYAILAGNGAHEVWDISNPYAPTYKAEMISPYYDPEKEAESHQVTYGRDFEGNYYFATTSGRGIDIWDVTDTVNPRLAAEITLPGIEYGDLAQAIWGLSWQGNYIYAGATNNGIYIIDVSSPNLPRLETIMEYDQIGRNYAGPVFALGDLLVVTTPKSSAGIATVDISDPRSPKLMDSIREIERSYIGGFYGTHAFLINPLRIFDVTSDPYNISKVSSFEIPVSEYVSFADDYLFLGGLREDSWRGGGEGTHGIYKFDIRDLNNLQLIERIPGRDPRWDDQFSCPVGNLVLMADDEFVDNQYVGAVIAVHETAPDLTPPSVKAFYPANQATSLSTSGQVAVSFSEWIEFKSVDPSSFILRPVNGEPLRGTWGCTYSVLTFSPDSPLEAATEYEIVLPAGGITDLVGNPLALTYTSKFTTSPQMDSLPSDIELEAISAVELGKQSSFSVVNPDPEHDYSWNFGDGQTATGSTVSHTYSEPGRYVITFEANAQTDTQQSSDNRRLTTKTFSHVVHNPVTNLAPTSSQPIVLANGKVWAVNPDANTISAVDTTSLTKLFEIPVGAEPKSIAHAPDGHLWVTCRKSTEIKVINTNDGSIVNTLALPYASQPCGIAFAPDGQAAFVALQALGRLLKLDPTTGKLLAFIDLGPDLDGRTVDIRELAIKATSDQVYVARFISPDQAGMVYVVNVDTMTLENTILLSKSVGVDSSSFARGLPNYLNSITISPDGTRAWIAAKKDNIDRGAQLDGLNLGHDNVVRAITPILDLTTNTDLIEQRIDYDNRDRCSSCTFSNRGDLVFVTFPGNNQVQVVDAYSGSEINTLLTQDVPIGAVLENSSGKLFVLNFLGRSLSVFDVNPMLEGQSNADFIRNVPLVSSEPLPANVLNGKKLFYNAISKALNLDGYVSCASCHIDGSHDGRTYDFSAPMGEGLRNTIDLRGRAGLKHGRLHWTGNFDEVHDFENQIRRLGRGIGLMHNEDFILGDRSEPLGDPKSNISDRLDDLAAYVHSLTEIPPSPYRQANGFLTIEGQAGRARFNQLRCYSCHGGKTFTDSKYLSGALHNVGTLTSKSGQRTGQPLNGLDTPSLLGVWATAPYLHDGSAPTLRDVLTTRNLADQHGAISNLNSEEIDELIAYLKQIDGNEPPALPTTTVTAEAFRQFVAIAGLTDEDASKEADPDADGFNNFAEFVIGGTSPIDPRHHPEIRSSLFEYSDANYLQLSWLQREGGVWQDDLSYAWGDTIYRAEGSFDLKYWDCQLVYLPVDLDLPIPPSGFRWATFRIIDSSLNSDKQFLRLRIESNE